MRRLRDIPIQRKLRVVILGTCSAALVVACAALFTLQFFFFKRDFVRDLSAVAQIVANNSSAALTFNDEDAARENLLALRAKPNITGAALVRGDGTTLAQVGDALLPTDIGLPVAPGMQTVDGEWV